MSYKNPTGPQKFKKKDTDQLSEKRKLQLGLTLKQIMKKLPKAIGPVSDKDIKFIKEMYPKTKKKKSKNPHKD